MSDIKERGGLFLTNSQEEREKKPNFEMEEENGGKFTRQCLTTSTKLRLSTCGRLEGS